MAHQPQAGRRGKNWENRRTRLAVDDVGAPSGSHAKNSAPQVVASANALLSPGLPHSARLRGEQTWKGMDRKWKLTSTPQKRACWNP